MTVLVGLGLLTVSAALLAGGAELFVEHAAGAARRLGVTVLAVGLLLAGAEPEELLTAVIAAVRDRPDLAAGDAIGANVTMLTVVLGLGALLAPLPVRRRVRLYALLSVVAGLAALAAVADGAVSRAEGAALVVGYLLLVGLVWWREKEPPALGELAEMAEEADGDEGGDGDEEGGGRGRAGERPTRALALVLLGVALMVAGGQVAVEGAVRVVDALDLTDTAVGLTLLALATTAELFALVLAAARKDVSEIAVAGVVGSAAYNALATLGAAALARPLPLEGLVGAAVAAAVLPLVVVALALLHRDRALGRVAGAVLCLGYAGYVVLVLR